MVASTRRRCVCSFASWHVYIYVSSPRHLLLHDCCYCCEETSGGLVPLRQGRGTAAKLKMPGVLCGECSRRMFGTSM